MTLQDLLTQVQVGQATALTIEKDVKPGVTTIQVSQRAVNAEDPRAPKRAETPKRCHAFLTAASLGDYLKKYGNPDTVIYADSDAGQITAILTETAKDGVEAMTMRPKVHPSAAPWRAIAGKTIELATFLDVILQNRRAITKPDAKELITILSQLKATKKIEVQRGRGTKTLNGVMVEFELQGKINKEIVEIPETMTIVVPIFLGTEASRIDLDLTIDGDANEDGMAVMVRISASQWAEAELAAFEAMIGTAQEHAGKNVGLTVLGAPNHKPWDYLK